MRTEPPFPAGTVSLQCPRTARERLMQVSHARSVRPSIANHLATALTGYDLGPELGRGAMGVVYLATQRSLNRPVALKMIIAGGAASAAELARFRKEAEVMARLTHPNVLHIYEFGEIDGLPWFALEYCPGGTLADRLLAGPLPPRTAAHVVRTLADALAAVHRQGVVHRDLKPGNVLLSEADGPLERCTLKVADFGLVRDGEGQGTSTGALLGSPAFMAPEQAFGQHADRRADIYAWGRFSISV